MEDFFLLLLLASFIWLAVRVSTLSTRIKHLEDQQDRLPAPPQPQTASAPPRPAAIVRPPAPAPYRAPYIPPPPFEKPAPPRPAPAPPTFTEAAPREPKPHVSLEARLGQNWLNKLGITALVIGLALGLGKIVTTLGPLGKDAIGFTLAIAILALGIFLERKPAYKLFARVLIGGGWALTFFLSFALYHVTLLQVLHSEAADLILMFFVAAGMVIHSLRYHSQTVTTFAFLLAFVTVGLSEVTLFSLVAGAILTAALALIVYRERWYALGLAGLIGVYLNHYLWLQRALPDGGIAYLHQHGHPFPEFLPSALLLLAYWLIFRLIYVLRPPLAISENPQHDLEQTLATLAALLNSAGLLGLLKYQSSHPEWAFYGLIALGLVELALSLIARGGLKPDADTQPNRIAFITLSTLASLFLLAAIPFHFHGSSWPLFWLLEAEAFYLTGIRIPERIFRRLGILASLFTGAWLAFAMLGVVLSSAFLGIGTTETPSSLRALPTLLAAAAVLYFNAEFTTRRWHFITEQSFDRIALIVGGWFATALIALLCWYKLEPVSIAVAWALLGLTLFELGYLVRSAHLRHQGYALLAAAFIRIFFANLNLTGHTSLYTVLPLIAAFAWVYERTQSLPTDVSSRPERSAAERPASGTRLDLILGALFAWCSLIAAGTLLYFELHPSWVILAWTLLAFALLALACALKRTIFIAQSLVVLLAIALRGIFYHLFSPTPLAETFATSRPFTIGATSALLLAALPLAFYLRRYFASLTTKDVSSRPEAQSGVAERPAFETGDDVSSRPERSAVERPAFQAPTTLLILLHHPEQPFFFVPLTLITLLLYVQLNGGRITIGWVALGLITFLFALTVKERPYRLSGLGLLLLGVAKVLAWDVWHVSPTDRYLTLIIMGASLLLVSFLYSRYRETLLNFL